MLIEILKRLPIRNAWIRAAAGLGIMLVISILGVLILGGKASWCESTQVQVSPAYNSSIANACSDVIDLHTKAVYGTFIFGLSFLISCIVALYMVPRSKVNPDKADPPRPEPHSLRQAADDAESRS